MHLYFNVIYFNAPLFYATYFNAPLFQRDLF